jgi:hypothetical protein
MHIQSRTYNNGTILEYIYTIVPAKGESYENSVFLDINTGNLIDPSSRQLVLDSNSENTFQGICCNVVFNDDCEGWITEAGACWTTEDGLSWSI